MQTAALAPSDEGAVEGGGTPSETEGEITKVILLSKPCSEDKLPLSLPPSCLGLHLGNPPPSSEGGKTGRLRFAWGILRASPSG